MAETVGVKLQVDGEQEYRKALQDVVAQSKALASEMKAVTSSFDENTTAEERQAKTKEILNKQIENQQRRIDLLNEKLQEATAEYGENDSRALKYKTQINNATVALNGMEKQLAETNTEISNTAEETENAEKASSTFADVLKANLLSDAIKSGFTALTNAVKSLASAMSDAIKDSSAFADEILTLSQTTGLSTDTLQEFSYMAELIDVDLGTVTSSMKKLTKQMSSAQSGSKTTSEAFSTLGVAVTNADGSLRNNEEVFYDVIAALQGVTNETERDALAMEIFGKSATELNPLINAGADGLEALRTEAQATGYVLNDEQLSALGAVDDAYQRWNNTLDTVKRQIAVGVAPAMESFMTTVKDMVAQIDWEAVGQSLGTLFDKLVETLSTVDLSTVIDTIVNSIIGFIDTISQIDFGAIFEGVSNIMNFITEYGGIVAGAIAGIVAVITAMQIASLATTPAVISLCATLAPFIAPIAGVVAGITALIAIIKNWGAISEWLKTTWENVKNAVVNTFNNLKERVSQAFQNMGNAIREKVSNIKETVSNVFGKIKDTVMGVVSGAWNWGKDLVSGLVDGIKSKVSAVKDAVSNVANTIKSWLHFSRPDEGVLRDYETWMPDFMQGLANGIKNNIGVVRDAMADVSEAMIVNPSIGGTVSNPSSFRQVSPSFAITINGGNASAQQIADEVMNRIQLDYERTAYTWE